MKTLKGKESWSFKNLPTENSLFWFRALYVFMHAETSITTTTDRIQNSSITWKYSLVLPFGSPPPLCNLVSHWFALHHYNVAFPECHTSRTIQYAIFWDWLLWLGTYSWNSSVFWRYSFFLMAKWYIIVWMYHNFFFIHLAIEGHLGCLQFAPIINSAMHIHVQTFVRTEVFISLGWYPGDDERVLWLTYIWLYTELPKCFVRMTVQFCLLTDNVQEFQLFCILATTWGYHVYIFLPFW